MAMRTKKTVQSFDSLFEDEYLIRTLGQIAQDSEVALTELVANAWDAGAALVDIAIPDALHGDLTVQDDDHGMTAAQFKARWMKLSYDLVKHQSSCVEFPPERANWTRRAYGHNGVGRHGMLCFADIYEVQTWRAGKGASVVVSTHSQATPFKVDSLTPLKRPGLAPLMSSPPSQIIGACARTIPMSRAQTCAISRGVAFDLKRHPRLERTRDSMSSPRRRRGRHTDIVLELRQLVQEQGLSSFLARVEERGDLGALRDQLIARIEWGRAAQSRNDSARGQATSPAPLPTPSRPG